MALVFVGGRPEGLVHIESSPRRQGKLQGSSPHVPITSYQCNRETGSFANGGIHAILSQLLLQAVLYT